MKKFFNAVCFLILFYIMVPLPSVLAAHGEVTVQTLFQLGTQRPVELNMYDGNAAQYVEEDNQTKIAVFYNSLANDAVTPITSPVCDKTYGHLTFAMQDGTRYSYYNSKFIIQKPTGETIKMLYTIGDHAILNAMKKANIEWSRFGSSAGKPHKTYDFVFDIGNHLYFKDYQAGRPIGIDGDGNVVPDPQNRGIEIDENPAVVPFVDAKSGRAMVPLRCLAELLEFFVDWNEKTQEIILEKDGFSVILKPENKIAELRQQKEDRIGSREEFYYRYTTELDASPQIVNGRTFVPVRFVAEIFDCNVTWNEERGRILINQLNSVFSNNIETFPILDLEKSEISLKTYNTGNIPFVEHFKGNIRLQANIYNKFNKKILTIKQPEPQSTTRLFYPDVPDTFSVTDSRLKTLPAGRYYADIQFGPEEKTKYRIFFDKE